MTRYCVLCAHTGERALLIPLACDGRWYERGMDNGVKTWVAKKDIFPDGLQYFQVGRATDKPTASDDDDRDDDDDHDDDGVGDDNAAAAPRRLLCRC
jgi:hypothetical protein